MFTSIWEDIQQQFRSGNMVTRLVIINVAVIVVFHLTALILSVFMGGPGTVDLLTPYLAVPSNLWDLLFKPWTIITSMFFHVGLWHVLFNMLWLYWFGRIVGDLIGDRYIFPLYLLSGLFGTLCFIVGGQFIPQLHGSIALGASGAVSGIMVAAAVQAPNYRVYLPLIGGVAIKWIVLIVLLTYVIGINFMDNTGGHLAHLGGSFFGFLFIHQLNKVGGIDFATPVNDMLDWMGSLFAKPVKKTASKSRPNPRVVFRNKKAKASRKANAQTDEHDLSHQEQLDVILDKIKRNGYDSLSKTEKEFLFKASKK